MIQQTKYIGKFGVHVVMEKRPSNQERLRVFFQTNLAKNWPQQRFLSLNSFEISMNPVFEPFLSSDRKRKPENFAFKSREVESFFLELIALIWC